ncbi:MAG: hypothetical protein LBD18_04830 [Treponema sp.]|jgi:hypothetical protein|nr:hypothetical protein [Treponema sp.]
MKKFLFCFMALLLSMGAVFAVETRTPPPPLEETQTPPPPLEEAAPTASPYDTVESGTKTAAATPGRSGQPALATTRASGTAASKTTASNAAVSKTTAAAKKPSTGTASSKPAAPNRAAPKKPQLTPVQDRAARLKSIGVSVGTSLASPLIIGTFRVTMPPARNMFIELGFDYGAFTTLDADYESMYPYAHFAYFKPFAHKGGWYLSGGMGYMMQTYSFKEYDLYGFTEHKEEGVNVFAIDIGAGLVLWNFLDLSYTIRTDFSTANHKISLGYIYRFK